MPSYLDANSLRIVHRTNIRKSYGGKYLKNKVIVANNTRIVYEWYAPGGRIQKFVQKGGFFFPGAGSAPVGAWKPPEINRLHNRSRGGLAPIAPPLNTPLVRSYIVHQQTVHSRKMFYNNSEMLILLVYPFILLKICQLSL